MELNLNKNENRKKKVAYYYKFYTFKIIRILKIISSVIKFTILK